MIDLNDYFYFVHVVEKQGFSPAAKALDIPKSRLSRHVSKLEERLDIKLIQRTSRQFKVTEAGQVFYQHAKALLEEMEAAEAAIQSRKSALSGRVTMSCSVGVAQFAIKNLVLQFLADHPKIELVQQVTNQNIDLVSSGIDVAIRGHTDTLPDSSIIQRHLTTVSWYLFASPGYLARTGTPKSPYDLFKRQSLKVGWQPASGHWTLQDKEGLKTMVPFNPQLCSDDMGTLKSAAMEGLGIVSLPAYLCREEIANGSLVRVLPNWISDKAQLSLMTPSRKGQSPSVRKFSEFLLDNLNDQISD
ncbi:LysR substrate-binding domain-containing protein [Porticoccaceae bacterium]|nr:LysR substrate-binding domain-containing protein [Porticoccaceae bacterium]MDB2343272.1 LysR substrate-binding domain-containing protein [Porticoccaceae bacterium]MDB2634094.1 LysR substrate-binding domain-containing protein [Porticoccaceae bacterium]MDB2663929.1 LysR substrate-binding domain-containing protein [Porticoccaceae bacterium]